MQKELIGALVQIGSQFASQMIVMAFRPKLLAQEREIMLMEYPKTSVLPPEPPLQEMPMPEIIISRPLALPAAAPSALPETENKATAVKTGCIPCSLGHWGAANGMLAEAMRFARKEGLGSGEVIDRVGEALDEFNALERKDMTPAMMQQLPPWEHDLAEKALAASRKARHDLEALQSVDDLERAAAFVETTRKEIGRAWFQEKFKTLSPENQQKVRTLIETRQKEAEDAPVPAASGV